MRRDDDGRQHAVTLDEAMSALLGLLTGATLSTDAGEQPWISYAADSGKDRGERCISIEITDPSGLTCEPFQIVLTRDDD